jgi:hypothetical protein
MHVNSGTVNAFARAAAMQWINVPEQDVHVVFGTSDAKPVRG